MDPIDQEPRAADLREYLHVLRSRKWSIVLVTAAVVALVLVFSFRQTPVYEGTARVLVRPFSTASTPAPATVDLVTEQQLITTPVVASTRLFCRYTGVEIVGCAEQQVSNHRAIRGESCCVRRTVQPLDAARPASDERFEPAALAVAVPLADWVPQSAVRRFVFTVRTVGSGPPAFLSHRALLI